MYVVDSYQRYYWLKIMTVKNVLELCSNVYLFIAHHTEMQMDKYVSMCDSMNEGGDVCTRTWLKNLNENLK